MMGVTSLVLLALLARPSGEAVQQPASAANPILVRVCVITDDDGDPSELADRQQSVKDLVQALASKKKTIVVIQDEDAADVVLDVVGRGVNTPRVVIGLGPRPGQPGRAPAPVRTAVLQVRFAQREDTIVVANRNKPFRTPGG